jgi:adenylate kinase family enzyme
MSISTSTSNSSNDANNADSASDNEANQYVNGKIYMIVSSETDAIYIGSTTQSLKRRLSEHRRDYKHYLQGKCRYISSFELIKFSDSCEITLLEAFPCESNEELRKREQYYIKQHPAAVNKQNAYTSPDQRKENMKKYMKKYNNEHKEQRNTYGKEYSKEYRESVNAPPIFDEVKGFVWRKQPKGPIPIQLPIITQIAILKLQELNATQADMAAYFGFGKNTKHISKLTRLFANASARKDFIDNFKIDAIELSNSRWIGGEWVESVESDKKDEWLDDARAAGVIGQLKIRNRYGKPQNASPETLHGFTDNIED